MIQPLFNTSQIRAHMMKAQERIEKAILQVLMDNGEKFVTDCRNQPKPSFKGDKNERKYHREKPLWFDDSGNLMSSIGYFIYKGDVLLFSDGDENAKSVVATIPKKANTYYLIGVAGMNYAAAVEAKGYNVISNQTIKAIDLLKGDFKTLNEKF